MERTQRRRTDRERSLTREIGRLADHVRDLRRDDARGNRQEISVVTADLRAKWDEMRMLRGAVAPEDQASFRRGGRYV